MRRQGSSFSLQQSSTPSFLMGPQLLLLLLTLGASAEIFWQEGYKRTHRDPSKVFLCHPPNFISARKSLNMPCTASSTPGSMRLRVLVISPGPCRKSMAKHSSRHCPNNVASFLQPLDNFRCWFPAWVPGAKVKAVNKQNKALHS